MGVALFCNGCEITVHMPYSTFNKWREAWVVAARKFLHEVAATGDTSAASKRVVADKTAAVEPAAPGEAPTETKGENKVDPPSAAAPGKAPTETKGENKVDSPSALLITHLRASGLHNAADEIDLKWVAGEALIVLQSRWVDDRGRWSWEKVRDSRTYLDDVEALRRAGLRGLLTFMDHVDDSGSFTPGEVVDIRTTYQLIGAYDPYPSTFSNFDGFKELLEHAVKHGKSILMC